MIEIFLWLISWPLVGLALGIPYTLYIEKEDVTLEGIFIMCVFGYIALPFILWEILGQYISDVDWKKVVIKAEKNDV